MVAMTRRTLHLLLGILLLAALVLAEFHPPKLDAIDDAMLEEARRIYKNAHETAGQAPTIANIPISRFDHDDVLSWRLYFMPKLGRGSDATIVVGKKRPYWKLGSWRFYYGRKRMYYAARVGPEDYDLAQKMGLKSTDGKPDKEAFALWRKVGGKPKLLSIDKFDIVPGVEYPLTSIKKLISEKDLFRIKAW
ncbi:uncharacterized protein UTRI_10681 [Ustilago trichophora]|uniref:Uncharacterized protein n=1 Tax=Ustilago trichophora TaxID=86804 RepID=A0A5C3E8T2_9BASI|nr:uncharacterized protein UTRI_10681 [Ustilago trichophora]